MSKPTGERSGWAIGIAAGALYGLLTRLFFSTPGYRGGWLESIFPIMSIAFVFVMPFVLGAITVWFGRHQDTKRLRFMVLGPWTSCILMLLSALLFKWEGIICVVLLLPVFLVASLLGGIAMNLLLRHQDRSRLKAVGWLAFTPFAFALVERNVQPSTEICVVTNTVMVHAQPERLWD